MTDATNDTQTTDDNYWTPPLDSEAILNPKLSLAAKGLLVLWCEILASDAWLAKKEGDPRSAELILGIGDLYAHCAESPDVIEATVAELASAGYITAFTVLKPPPLKPLRPHTTGAGDGQ